MTVKQHSEASWEVADSQAVRRYSVMDLGQDPPVLCLLFWLNRGWGKKTPVEQMKEDHGPVLIQVFSIFWTLHLCNTISLHPRHLRKKLILTPKSQKCQHGLSNGIGFNYSPHSQREPTLVLSGQISRLMIYLPLGCQISLINLLLL